MKVARNTSWLVVAMFVSRILTAVFVILLANYLLPDNFGIYNFAMAVSYVVAVMADWGFDELAVKEVSRKPSRGPDILGNMLAIRALLGLATIGILAALYSVMFARLPTGMSLSILLLAGTMLILEKVSGSFISMFQAHERMELHALTNILWSILFLSLGIAGILLGYDLVRILFLLLLSYAVNLIISLSVYTFKLRGGVNRPRVSDWLPLLKKASPFTLFIMVSVLYGHVIILLLAVIRGDFETGIYGASWKIIVFFGAIPYSFGRALYPVFSKFSLTDISVMDTAYKYSLRYLLIISLPLTIGLFIVAEDMLGIIYRVEYSQTVSVFRTMVWAIPFLFMNGSLKMVLWGSDRTLASSRNLIVASMVLVVTGVLLIPGYGTVGAATAIVLAEMTHFFANYHSVTSYMEPVGLSLLWKPYLACGVMAAVLYIPLGIGMLSLLPFAIAAYFIILYLVKGVTREDLGVLKAALGL